MYQVGVSLEQTGHGTATVPRMIRLGGSERQVRMDKVMVGEGGANSYPELISYLT